MSKSNLILSAVVGLLVAILSSTGVSACSAACASTCGGKSATEARAGDPDKCSGWKEKSWPEKTEARHGFLTCYFEIRNLLSQDKVEGVSGLSKSLAAETEKFRKAAAKSEASAEKLQALEEIEKAASGLNAKSEADGNIGDRLDVAREGFKTLSRRVLAYVQDYGCEGTACSFHCPMAKESWLQETDKPGNPYYGSEMFECGKITGRVVKGKYMAVKVESDKRKAEKAEAEKRETVENEAVKQEHGCP